MKTQIPTSILPEENTKVVEKVFIQFEKHLLRYEVTGGRNHRYTDTGWRGIYRYVGEVEPALTICGCVEGLAYAGIGTHTDDNVRVGNGGVGHGRAHHLSLNDRLPDRYAPTREGVPYPTARQKANQPYQQQGEAKTCSV